MTRSLKASIPTRAISGAVAGVVGGVAHAMVNEVDRKILNHEADDLILLGGVFTDDSQLARKIGICMHLNFAAMFGAAFAMLLRPQNDRDALRKGIGFALAENFTLFPLGILVDKYHPYVRSGMSDPFFHPTSLVQATLRHLALGAGIGASYSRLIKAIRP